MTANTIWKDLRRVITGVDEKGRSRVIYDDNLPNRQIFDEAGGLHEVWTDPGDPLNRRDTKDQTDRPVTIAPEKHGVRFRYFSLAPASALPADMTDEAYRELVKEVFASVGSAHHQPDTTRHAAMHETPTIDCIILLQGRVKLILDDDERELKPHDIVIQRGTNHAWEVIGDDPALLVAVLIDREFADA